MNKGTKRVALIVGAGTELGQAVARQLATNGVRVALNDLLPDRVELIAKEIQTTGGEAIVYATDLSRKLALQTVLQNILEAWARIDILIFIASNQPADALLDIDEWDWHRSVDLNLTAAFLCMQSVGRVMRELGGGVIVNMLAGSQRQTSAAYQAAAAGLTALSEAAKQELNQHYIRVYTMEAMEISPKEIAQLCLSSVLALTKNQ
jgi:NAD(P)-dependent dehydrogenase (short-subunit alcohol dehydrogenase family)